MSIPCGLVVVTRRASHPIDVKNISETDMIGCVTSYTNILYSYHECSIISYASIIGVIKLVELYLCRGNSWAMYHNTPFLSDVTVTPYDEVECVDTYQVKRPYDIKLEFYTQLISTGHICNL
jgi:hypothetical protein